MNKKNDTCYSSANGSTPMEEDSNSKCMPDKIMNGGDHSDDFIRNRIPINNVPREHVLQIASRTLLKNLHA